MVDHPELVSAPLGFEHEREGGVLVGMDLRQRVHDDADAERRRSCRGLVVGEVDDAGAGEEIVPAALPRRQGHQQEAEAEEARRGGVGERPDEAAHDADLAEVDACGASARSSDLPMVWP